ncbi:pilin [Snodgrassella sp. CS2]|uniref:pilin n=1 Tax=Snodgrassella sp. CS2 TaxID=3418953 RepID=UPI003CFC8FC2
MNKLQAKGFTLIEIMIAITVIGILAAIAVPLYADYSARAQLAEGVNLAGNLKAQVLDNMQHQRCRAQNQSEYRYTGRYGIAEINTEFPLSNVQNSASAQTGCQIKYTVYSQKASSVLINRYMILDVLANGTLKFNNGTIDTKYLPKALIQ